MAVARGLGWFSIGLGLVEALSPGIVTRTLGMEGKEGLVRGYGVREIGTGIGILAANDPSPWLWGRVAGDALDLADFGDRAPGRPRAQAQCHSHTRRGGRGHRDRCRLRPGARRFEARRIRPTVPRLQRTQRHAAPGREHARRGQGFRGAARHANPGSAAPLHQPAAGRATGLVRPLGRRGAGAGAFSGNLPASGRGRALPPDGLLLILARACKGPLTPPGSGTATCSASRACRRRRSTGFSTSPTAMSN